MGFEVERRAPIAHAATLDQRRRACRMLPVAACAMLPISGCHHGNRHTPPPVRSLSRLATPAATSTIAVPVEAKLDDLARGIDSALPGTLWTIDQRVDRCIPPQRVKLLGAKVKILPAIPCSLSGEVTHGAITLHGEGRELVADIPVEARITARDVKGRLKGETATGSARVQARITLDLAPDWTPRARVRLHYDWTTPPGVELLGQRITFTDKADEKLQPVLRRLERNLPTELAKLHFRQRAAAAWRSAFTSVSLNDENPPVWMRITPRRVMYDGYRIEDGRIRLAVGLEAKTETFVGRRPQDPAPTPLPPISTTSARGEGLSLFIPVTADYAQLEPVIFRALVKRSARPFVLPGIGPVAAHFDHLVAYGTPGRRIAVGIDLRVHPVGSPSDVTRGRIWLTARPVNAPGSARIGFADLSVAGDTNGVGGDILVALGNSPGFSELVASALQQNLSRDFGDLVAKVRRAIADKRIGDFVVQARIDRIRTGTLLSLGDGVHLPVQAIGTATLAYRPEGGIE